MWLVAAKGELGVKSFAILILKISGHQYPLRCYHLHHAPQPFFFSLSWVSPCCIYIFMKNHWRKDLLYCTSNQYTVFYVWRGKVGCEVWVVWSDWCPGSGLGASTSCGVVRHLRLYILSIRFGVIAMYSTLSEIYWNVHWITKVRWTE